MRLVLSSVFSMAWPLALAASEGESAGGDFLTPLVPQMVWSAVTFLIVLAVLWKTAWPAIMGALDERARRIQESLEAAEKAREGAEAERSRASAEFEAERRRLRETMARAHTELAQAREGILDAARAEGAALRRQAEASIERAKVNAIDEIRTTAVDLALAAAEAVLRRRLSAEDDRRFAQEVVDAVSKGPRGAA